MTDSCTQRIDDILRQAPVVPVLAVSEVEDAVPLAEALVAAGLPVLEITLRTAAALDVIRRMREVPGAIVGGLIIGASEKLAEVYIGPLVGGGIEGWFPYVLALFFLLVRPEGLFGEKHIDRV